MREAFVTAVLLFHAQRERTTQFATFHACGALAMGRYRRRVD
jgi:hypothetical protein